MTAPAAPSGRTPAAADRTPGGDRPAAGRHSTAARNAELAARYGTPLYVYDLDRATAARDALRAVLPEQATLFYSFKANPHPGLARVFGEGGEGTACRAEVSSTGELANSLAAGFDPARTLYTGPGKTGEEIGAALAAGVRWFSVESPGDLRRVGAAAQEHGTTAQVLLRINAAASGASTSIRMTGAPSQFGLDSETLPELMPELLAVPGTKVAGAHFFPLSNSRDEQSLVDEFTRSIGEAAGLAERLGLPLDVLDIGGGFAAPYAVPGELPVYDKLKAELEQALDTAFPRWRDGTPHLAFESGRHLAGTTGELVTAVANVKTSRGRTFVILDAGINTLGGMAGLGRLLPLAVKPDELPESEEQLQRASLVGPLCTPGDILGRDLDVRALAPGDLVTVPNVGAYGPTASLLGFLGRPAPAEVVVRGGEIVSASRLELARTDLG